MSENIFSVIQQIAERKIVEAQERGEFENLPGSGKPLQIEDDSNIPEDLRMAWKVLRNAGCLPPEIADRKEVSNIVELLENCQDEQLRLKNMQRLRFLVQRIQYQHNRSTYLDEDSNYYSQLLDKLEKKQYKNN